MENCRIVVEVVARDDDRSDRIVDVESKESRIGRRKWRIRDQIVPKKMADHRDIRLLRGSERYAMGPVQYHRQYRHEILRGDFGRC